MFLRRVSARGITRERERRNAREVNHPLYDPRGSNAVFNQYKTMSEINDLARQAFNIAIIRGKTEKDAGHLDTFFGILSELKEFREASEVEKSEHLPQYTEAQEELTDVLICCLTELYRREVDVERIVKEKVEFNKTRV